MASANTTSECFACGNGVVEFGEVCEPKGWGANWMAASPAKASMLDVDAPIRADCQGYDTSKCGPPLSCLEWPE